MLFLEVAEEIGMRTGMLKGLQRMERIWAYLDVGMILMDIPSWWSMIGDKELQQAVHYEEVPEQTRRQVQGLHHQTTPM
jgi:hypothetical protein